MPFVNNAPVKGTKKAPGRPPSYYPPGYPWPPKIDIPMSAQFSAEQIAALNQLTPEQLDEIGLPPVITPFLVVTNNQVQVTLIDPGESRINNGLKYDENGFLYVTIATPGAESYYVSPFRVAADGAVYVTLDAPHYYNSGFAFNAAGALCYSNIAGTGYVQGWPVNAWGVCMNGVATVPGAPTSVVAVSGNGEATISWVAPSSGGSPITGYRIRSTPTTSTKAPSSSPYVFTGLTNGVEYTFEVAAVNAVGQGPWSSVSLPVTPATVPDAPTSVTATEGDGQATVSWTIPATGGSPITGYVVRSVPATANQNATSSPHVFTGLTNGTAYGFEVAAVNSKGQGPWSSTSPAVTPNPQPMFFVPLLSTVVPTTAGGSATATNTRSTVAYVTDFEGILKRAIVNEARFWGARRVHNVILRTQNLENTGDWASDFGTVTRTANFGTAPDGTTTSTRLQFSGANGAWVFTGSPNDALATVDNLAYKGSIYVKGTAGQTINIWTRLRSSGTNQSAKQVTLTGAWDRITPDGTTTNNDTTSNLPALCIGTRNLDLALGTAADVQVWGGQMEAVTGQTIQIPSEYVSSGVNSAPYHGACVTGVKYFTTQNGNSVSGGIVTEATGSAISDTVLRGVVIEPTDTNVCLRSQEFDNASWTKNNSTITANQIAAPDGTVTADLFTDNSTNGPHNVTLTIASQGGAGIAFSVYVKAGTLTWMQISTTDSSRYANFNISTGALGNTSASSVIEPIGNGWYRCTLAITGSGAASTILISGLSGNTASAAPSYVGSSQTMYLWGAQVEQEYQATSYIPTTTASANRQEDTLSYVSSGNYNTTVGSAYAEFAQYGITGDAKNHGVVGGSGYYMLNATSSKPAMNNGSGGTLTVANNGNVAGGRNKMMCRWGHTGATRGIIQNGSTIASGAWSGTYADTNLWIGKWAGSAGTAKGGVRNVKLYSTALSDALMTSLTT